MPAHCPLLALPVASKLRGVHQEPESPDVPLSVCKCVELCTYLVLYINWLYPFADVQLPAFTQPYP